MSFYLFRLSCKYFSHPTMLVVECFPPCLVLFLFLQILFCKVFLGACCVISSKKACCRLVPTILFGLAYNSWKNDPTCAEIFEKKHNWGEVWFDVPCLKTFFCKYLCPGWSVIQTDFCIETMGSRLLF